LSLDSYNTEIMLSLRVEAGYIFKLGVHAVIFFKVAENSTN